MKRPASLLLLVLVMSVFAVGCSRPNNEPAATVTPKVEEAAPVQAINKGYIVQKDGDRLLVTAYVQANGAPAIDAFWFTTNDRTVLQNKNGQTITPDQPAIGDQVDVWSTGKVMESYPAQAVAAKIIRYEDNMPGAANVQIGQTKAVQLALQSLTGGSVAKAVKSAALNVQNGYWNVELVRHETADQPVVVRVDARTGKIIPVPVAENDAFRVFSPKPGTEAGPVITVEGEARVFEAAFSWTLEDGHNILAQGHQMASEGAPAWGHFRFDIRYEKASQPNIMLILYVNSAKDGSVQQQLVIPLKVPKERISAK